MKKLFENFQIYIKLKNVISDYANEQKSLYIPAIFRLKPKGH